VSERRFYLIEQLGDTNDKDWSVLHNFVHDLEPESWRVTDGEPMAGVFPKDAVIHMTDRDRGPKLGSFVGNTWNMFIVSTQFRRLIEDACIGVPIEYLPLSIRDPRKRLLSADHHLVNPLGTFDCMDRKKSDIAWDDTNPKEIISVDSIVIDRRKIADAPELFRVQDDPTSYVIGFKLAQAMVAAKLTNVMWTKLPFND
jgi:hypothetical protein